MFICFIWTSLSAVRGRRVAFFSFFVVGRPAIACDSGIFFSTLVFACTCGSQLLRTVRGHIGRPPLPSPAPISGLFLIYVFFSFHFYCFAVTYLYPFLPTNLLMFHGRARTFPSFVYCTTVAPLTVVPFSVRQLHNSRRCVCGRLLDTNWREPCVLAKRGDMARRGHIKPVTAIVRKYLVQLL